MTALIGYYWQITSNLESLHGGVARFDYLIGHALSRMVDCFIRVFQPCMVFSVTGHTKAGH